VSSWKDRKAKDITGTAGEGVITVHVWKSEAAQRKRDIVRRSDRLSEESDKIFAHSYAESTKTQVSVEYRWNDEKKEMFVFIRAGAVGKVAQLKDGSALGIMGKTRVLFDGPETELLKGV